MEEEYNALSNSPELLSLCNSINQLVRKRESLREQESSEFSVRQAEVEISYKQLRLRNLIFESIHGEASIKKQDTSEKENRQEENTEIPPISMKSLFHSKREEVYYYTIIAKDHARKEMPELVDAYPDHFYYAIICIEAEDGQYVKIVQNESGEMTYYPELDQAETQRERIRIMNEFLDRLPDRYIHAKYEDLFGE